VLDTSAAAALGYTPVGDFASTVRAEIDWLASTVDRARPARLPTAGDDGRFNGTFGYDGEDHFLAGR
jgi:hypothetical protein